MAMSQDAKPNPIYCAIDTSNLDEAKMLVAQVGDLVGGLKIGLEFFCAHGPAAVCDLIGTRSLFLDLKFHDIPSTVARAMTAILPIEPDFVSIHLADDEMVSAAVRAVNAGTGQFERPRVLGVVQLTSSRVPKDPPELRVAADRVRRCGLDGVICSVRDLPFLRKKLGPKFLYMVPGIRLVHDPADDHASVALPLVAIENGASHIVIGRAITRSTNPARTVDAIMKTLRAKDDADAL